MTSLQNLYDAVIDLTDTASQEGCEKDLIVVGYPQFLDLIKVITRLKALDALLLTTASPQDNIPHICSRLLDSEEHATDSAIPPVAEQAAEIIKRLSAALSATNSALSQAMQYSEKAGKFVDRIAGYSIWGYDKDDGTPQNEFNECEEPSDGYQDSHMCLMSAIEDARKIQSGQA